MDHQNRDLTNDIHYKNLSLQETLQKIVQQEPQTEFLDLTNQNIELIQTNLMPCIAQLTNLKELNLEDNEIKSLPPDLS